MKCEIWLIVDANGDYWAEDDEDRVHERYGESDGVVPCRVIKLTVDVAKPVAQEVFGTIPADACEEVKLTAVEK